jgi:hypothetical protein
VNFRRILTRRIFPSPATMPKIEMEGKTNDIDFPR